ncbi:MAG: pyrroline-5-carboxylate reductase family protein, partial [Parvibaculales bacterium]
IPAQWVRVMPNIPASVGQAMSVAAVKQELGANEKEILQFLLEAVGMVSWAEEADMDAVTAISGSGPAYVFYLAECLAQAGEGLGLSSEQASQYARQTIIGAGEMLRLSSKTPAQLRENVTSPQGTTEAALQVFMEGEGLKKLMEKATKAAAKRSQELRGK